LAGSENNNNGTIEKLLLLAIALGHVHDILGDCDVDIL